MSPASRPTPRHRVGVLSVALLALVTLASADRVSAHPFVTGFADGVYQSSDRSHWLKRTVAARAGMVRLSVAWRDVVGHRPDKPRNPTDPAYAFGSLDAAVRSAHAHGVQVMLTISSAPAWAEGKHRPRSVPAGAWKPDPQAFGDFGHALAKRYSGSFSSGGSKLPRVRYFEAWNEPNLTEFLAPQWHGHHARSPAIYRRMLASFYRGVHSGDKRAKVIGGATAPFGEDPGGQRMRPITFLRGALCAGGGACTPKPHIDILSHHPIDRFMGPGHHAINPLDATVPDLPRVHRVLRQAQRAGEVRPRGKVPLWVTEFWWETSPPDSRRNAIPINKQARWVETALYLFWKAGARVALNFQIVDSKEDRGNPGSYQSGVYFHDGRPKPALTAFRFPFVVHGAHHGRVAVWGRAPAAGRVHIQVRKGGKWRTRSTRKVGARQIFTARPRLHGAGKLRAQVGRWTSLVWSQH